MPHFVMEYSRDVETRHDIKAAMEAAFDAGVASGEMGAHDLKIRAIPFDHVMLENEGESFFHTTVYLLSGRTEEQKKKIADLLLAALSEVLDTVTSVSIDMQDMDRAVYTKRVL